MKSSLKTLALIAAVSASLSACADMTPAQRNTAAGVVVGGVAGNLLGKDTGATLGGAALGGVIGSQIQ
ncbi:MULTISPECIES: glycine zipper 2TM domain-containing protein [unclassified Snodgrassella]|uniref:glycine zipper 2TM domain-containing protein n=1 Tax=unclassified Snodgrassella TaxID=2625236 RepID=UPI0018DB83D6|nr:MULTISPECIES: glycine zipper 2TM domain-containing protein [unclassified Snodgrassella]MBI0097587.1 glycine zipper 2TM domain-containing protein [Snodgrassella sp. W8134]MBI0100680.1 glycine zipper 2TM domain-containing protein [Snodgrassella sp. W8135]